MSIRVLFANALLLFFAWAQVFLPAVKAEESGAKGLYFEQLEQPQKYLNTGLQYWIELHRGEQLLKTNNKFSFRSRDQIRFHIRANVDGYAYIVLKSGSRGEQSVLFPEPGENNKIERGRDYALPRDGFLTFDENPGLEKVTLLLSRSLLDAHAYLRQNQERTLVASAAIGSKDLVPSKILLSYAPAAQSTQPIVKAKASPPAAPSTTPVVAKVKASKETIKIAQANKQNTPQKPLVPSTPKGKRKSHQAKQPILIAKQSPPVNQAETPANQGQEHKPSPQNTQDEGIVTVVYNDPSGVLALDVDLDHI